jgi:hypothetical protein
MPVRTWRKQSRLHSRRSLLVLNNVQKTGCPCDSRFVSRQEDCARLPIDRPIIATRIGDVECGQQVKAREMSWTGQPGVQPANRPIFRRLR